MGQHKQYEQMFKADPASLPELYFRARVAGVKRPGAQQTWPTLMRRLTGVRGNRPGTYLGAELTHVTQPTLVIYGEHDWTPDEVRAAAERMPNRPALRQGRRGARAQSDGCRSAAIGTCGPAIESAAAG
jgi:pimeloyl-ACP methyl ester carboxylesterase